VGGVSRPPFTDRGTRGNPQPVAKRIVNSNERGSGLVDSMCATDPAGNGKIDAKSKRTTLGERPSIVKRVSRIAFHKLVFLISVPRVPVTPP
ncbi:hypothetical protein BC827DRAFT_1227114, partial [Russula dissimulans]